ncbi:MAG: OadG family protein [Clostridia bacterium]|nr:OadG family protein [Clostridia bacterium]
MSTLTLLLSSGGFFAKYADELALSGEMMLRGIGTVFMVLIILWAILGAFGMIFSKSTKSAKEAAPKTEKSKETSKKEVQTAAAPAVQSAAQDDSALIAAITAAIIAYNTAEGKPNLPFRVVSYKRKNNAAGWMGNTADNQ